MFILPKLFIPPHLSIESTLSTVANATGEAGEETTVYSSTGSTWYSSSTASTTGSSTGSTTGYYSSSDASTTDSYGTESTPPTEASSSPASGNLADWMSSLTELAKMDGDWNIISMEDVEFMNEDEKVPGVSGLQIKMFRAYGN